nr:DUF4214 domain-containing protein [uncultured Duganella sp.]
MATTNASFGNALQGTLANNATDIYQLTANAGGVVKIDFRHPAATGSNGQAIELSLTDRFGNILTTQTVYGNTSFATTVASAGTYYLRVADANGSASNDTNSYTVTPTLTTVAGVTYDGATNNSLDTAIASAMGAPITGGLNAGDTDVFKVHADSDGFLNLYFVHPDGAGKRGAGILVDVLDASGNLVIRQTLYGHENIITTVAAAGDYYLKIIDGNKDAKHEATYTLTPTLVSQAGVVFNGTTNHSAATALSVPLGTTIMGTINSGESDYFKVNAISGGTLSLNFVHPQVYSLDGYGVGITILDSHGKIVLDSTEYGSNLLSTTLASGGDYYIKINDAAPHSSSGKGVYQLFAGMSSNGGVSLSGTPASDAWSGTGGNDFINGGGGLDTVSYQGNSGDYKINVSAVGAQVVDSLGRDGNDSLINVERLQFADKMVALDVDGVAGMAYRVYQAAFDRAPDPAGVGYWIAQMDKGASLYDVANSFIRSQEFQDKHGAGISNKDLVTAFYTNVLHRTPDQTGQNYWIGLLNNHQVDAADVLASFSTSAENVAQLTGVLSHGISYTPYLF